ncbi:FtsW/RodA/SpoVE family cell cycle protein [Phototrophicus methaneseepsis]|uniref:FtsW/RodA/SpoVE family cell cycle protein n=1 Tax=Phototrophicus methaneseepsis TaxID=2710758 RepID=A0A7S8IBV2_9CHLR|nr:FtsW/RodA/SpoVE family cell cycle protein [Phototrophicus methaneseepsis]QPC80865.1 FtsW/RodA/SpoVE family cell cycle protein [Phototrophicus methaneseepsis]
MTLTRPLVSEMQQVSTHRAERRLLIISAAFLLVNFVALALQRQTSAAPWLHILVWMVCALGGHLVLNRYLPHRDRVLFPLVMFLSGWGLIIIDRLAPTFADRQTIWLAISVAAMLAAAIFKQPLHWLRYYRYTLFFGGLALLVATIILGQNPSGSGPELWLGFAGVYFQPSEALKLILIAFLASYLGEQYPIMRRLNPKNSGPTFPIRILGPILLMWGLCVLMLIWQRDLGTAALFFIVFLTMLYIASGRTLIMIGGALLLLLAGILAYVWIDLVQLRIDIWLNPWPDADNRAFQIVQSLMAFGAGGIFGQGVAQGSPAYIPVVHSDFVMAALAEEWGLLGVIVVIICIAVIVMRATRIGLLNQARPFYTLFAVGIGLLIGVQSLLIMMGILKLLPLTGVTLPFLSYGGSSLLVSFIMVGLLLRLSSGVR